MIHRGRGLPGSRPPWVPSGPAWVRPSGDGVRAVPREEIEAERQYLEQSRSPVYADSSDVEGLEVATQVYVRLEDLDTFIAAIKTIAKEGIKS